MRSWLFAQVITTASSWSAGTLIITGLLSWLGVEIWIAVLLAATLAGVFPLLSFIELSVRRAFGGRPTVGLLDCLVSNVMVVAAPLAFGYSWVVGECLACGLNAYLALFTVLSTALPLAFIHWALSKKISQILC